MTAIDRFTPTTSVRLRLLLAAAAWTVVGAGLLAAGSAWLVRGAGEGWPAFLLVAGLAGWIKSRFVLESRARDNVARIVAAGEGRCLGGFFSWPSWAFVVGMIFLGAGLRRSPLPRSWLGVVYVAVGAALVLASRPAWRAWSRQRGRAGGQRLRKHPENHG